MAPKAAAAKANAKANAKAAPKYRPRPPGICVAPPGLQALNAQRRLAIRARAGWLRACPECGYPRFVPSAASCRYACAMPGIHAANGDWVRCNFRTTARAWSRRPQVSLAYEAASKTIMPDVFHDVDALCEAGTLELRDFWPTVKKELENQIIFGPQPPAPPPAAP